jgi:hypothetical protein
VSINNDQLIHSGSTRIGNDSQGDVLESTELSIDEELGGELAMFFKSRLSKTVCEPTE